MKLKTVSIGFLAAFSVILLTQTRPLSDVDQPAAFDSFVVSVGDGPGSIAIADVNHDGRLDILVANTISETLTVLLGDGRGRFHPAAGPPASTGRTPNDIAIGDFNADGHVDAVLANTETPYITILLGDGSGKFFPSPHSPFSTSSYPHVHGVAAADFNADGKLDVVTDSWGHDQILMLFGDGNGNLSLPGRLFATGRRPYQRLRSADFNHDGKPDVVTTDMDSNAVSVLLGDGKGGLRDAAGSPFAAGAFPWSIAVDDINKDGNLDLVVVPYERDVADSKQVGVTVLLGDGRGGFAKMFGSPFSLAGCRGPNRVAAGDVNGDGSRDIVVSCAQNDELMLYLGSKNGSFRTTSLAVPTGWSGLGVADLNGDGKDDIVVSGNPADSTASARPGHITVFLSK